MLHTSDWNSILEPIAHSIDKHQQQHVPKLNTTTPVVAAAENLKESIQSLLFPDLINPSFHPSNQDLQLYSENAVWILLHSDYACSVLPVLYQRLQIFTRATLCDSSDCFIYQKKLTERRKKMNNILLSFLHVMLALSAKVFSTGPWRGMTDLSAQVSTRLGTQNTLKLTSHQIKRKISDSHDETINWILASHIFLVLSLLWPLLLPELDHYMDFALIHSLMYASHRPSSHNFQDSNEFSALFLPYPNKSALKTRQKYLSVSTRLFLSLVQIQSGIFQMSMSNTIIDQPATMFTRLACSAILRSITLPQELPEINSKYISRYIQLTRHWVTHIFLFALPQYQEKPLALSMEDPEAPRLGNLEIYVMLYQIVQTCFGISDENMNQLPSQPLPFVRLPSQSSRWFIYTLFAPSLQLHMRPHILWLLFRIAVIPVLVMSKNGATTQQDAQDPSNNWRITLRDDLQSLTSKWLLKADPPILPNHAELLKCFEEHTGENYSMLDGTRMQVMALVWCLSDAAMRCTKHAWLCVPDGWKVWVQAFSLVLFYPIILELAMVAQAKHMKQQIKSDIEVPAVFSELSKRILRFNSKNVGFALGKLIRVNTFGEKTKNLFISDFISTLRQLYTQNTISSWKNNAEFLDQRRDIYIQLVQASNTCYESLVMLLGQLCSLFTPEDASQATQLLCLFDFARSDNCVQERKQVIQALMYTIVQPQVTHIKKVCTTEKVDAIQKIQTISQEMTPMLNLMDYFKVLLNDTLNNEPETDHLTSTPIPGKKESMTFVFKLFSTLCSLEMLTVAIPMIRGHRIFVKNYVAFVNENLLRGCKSTQSALATQAHELAQAFIKELEFSAASQHFTTLYWKQCLEMYPQKVNASTVASALDSVLLGHGCTSSLPAIEFLKGSLEILSSKVVDLWTYSFDSHIANVNQNPTSFVIDEETRNLTLILVRSVVKCPLECLAMSCSVVESTVEGLERPKISKKIDRTLDLDHSSSRDTTEENMVYLMRIEMCGIIRIALLGSDAARKVPLLNWYFKMSQRLGVPARSSL